MSTITAADLKTYAAAAIQTRARSTVVREITELRCAIRSTGLEPPKGPDLGPVHTSIEVWFDSANSARMLGELAPRRRDHAIVNRLAGLRYSELYKLQVHDVDAARGLVRIRGTKTKGSDRTVPMHPQVAEILQRRAASAQDRGETLPFPTAGVATTVTAT